MYTSSLSSCTTQLKIAALYDTQMAHTRHGYSLSSPCAVSFAPEGVDQICLAHSNNNFIDEKNRVSQSVWCDDDEPLESANQVKMIGAVDPS